MKSRIDSPLPGKLTRRMATVTIWAPDSSWACRMISFDEYLPVPTMSRDENSLPPITRFVSYMVLISLTLASDGEAPAPSSIISPLGSPPERGSPRPATTCGSHYLLQLASDAGAPPPRRPAARTTLHPSV